MRTNISNPRESMRPLPAFLQPFLTWLTGMPLQGAEPRFRFTAWARLGAVLFTLALGMGFSAAALSVGGAAWLLLPVGWLLSSGAMRSLYITIIHNAVHEAFSPSKRGNRFVAEVLSTILFLNGYDRFRADHARWHHGKKLGTFEDPDGQFIRAAKFGPGSTRGESWRRYWITMFSPRFHWAYLKQRFLTNFKDAPRYRIAMAVLWNSAIIGALVLTGNWIPFLVIWAFPLTILYQQSSFTQMMSEHRWFLPMDARGQGGARMTFARHLGDPYPGRKAPLAARLRFHARLFFIHLPLRLWVLVGADLHVHDYHHRHPRGDWANAAYARASDIDNGHPKWDEAYESIWGSHADHMNIVFDGWAGDQAPRNTARSIRKN